MTTPLGDLVGAHRIADVESEKAVAGVVLRDLALPEGVEPGLFTAEPYRCVVAAVRDLSDNGTPPAYPALRDRLSGTLDAQALGDLINAAPSTRHVGGFVRRLVDCYRTRRILNDSSALQLALADQDTARAGELLDAIREGMNGANGDLPRLKAIDLTALEETPVEWIADGWIARGDRVVLAGEAKSGKSILALSLALCAASGKPWLGRVDTAPCRVVYVDEENSSALARRRVRRLAAGLSVDPSDLPLLYLSRNVLNLDDPQRLAVLLHEIREFGPDLIILDSLVRLHRRNENYANEMAQFFAAAIDPMTANGTTLVFLHHMTKPGKDAPSGVARVRGSGEIFAFVETALLCERTEHARILKVAEEGSRENRTPPPIVVAFEDTADDTLIVSGEDDERAESVVLESVIEAGASGLLRQGVVLALDTAGFKASVRLATKILGKLNAVGRLRKRTEGRAVRYFSTTYAPADAV